MTIDPDAHLAKIAALHQRREEIRDAAERDIREIMEQARANRGPHTPEREALRDRLQADLNRCREQALRETNAVSEELGRLTKEFLAEAQQVIAAMVKRRKEADDGPDP